MAVVRTQVYVEAADHAAIQREARERGIAMTALVRQIVRAHVEGRSGLSAFRKEDILAFVALGRSGRDDGAEHHDAALAAAFADAPHLR